MRVITLLKSGNVEEVADAARVEVDLAWGDVEFTIDVGKGGILTIHRDGSPVIGGSVAEWYAVMADAWTLAQKKQHEPKKRR